MDTLASRAWLTKQLRHPVDDALWGALVSAKYTADVQDDEDRALLVEMARIFMRYGKQTARRARREESQRMPVVSESDHREPSDRIILPEASVRGESGNAERERAAVLSAYLAAWAAHQPDVVAFRSRYLRGQLLTESQARAFVRSEANGYVPGQTLEENGIDPANHTAKVASRKEVPVEYRDELTLEIEPAGVSVIGRVHRSKTLELKWPGRGKSVEHSRFSTGSVLHELHSVAEPLTRTFPWEDAEAVWFVLTGMVPNIPRMWASTPIENYGGMFRESFITVTARSWVSADSVREFFRQLQRQKAFHQTGRSLGPRTFALVRFAAEQYGERLSWRKRMDGWNQRYPKWQYPDVRNFQKDTQRAIDTVVDRDQDLTPFIELGNDATPEYSR